jgi:hypothetical protein
MANTRTAWTLPPVSLAAVVVAALVLSVGVIALDRIVAFGLKQLLLHSSYRYMRVYSEGPPAEYLVIGNSRAGDHFLHGTQANGDFFNLGNGGMGVAFASTLVSDYLDYHGAPKVVIVEMSFVTDPRLGEEAAGLTRVFSARSSAIGDNETGLQHAARRVFHLIRFNHPTLLNALVGLFWERKLRAVNTRVNEATIGHIEQMAPYELIPDPDNVTRIAQLISGLRRRGVLVVCVLSPLLPELKEKAANFASYSTALRSLATSNGGVFLDDSGAISDRKLFADSAHLNVDGVKEFDQIFFAQIAALTH